MLDIAIAFKSIEKRLQDVVNLLEKQNRLLDTQNKLLVELLETTTRQSTFIEESTVRSRRIEQMAQTQHDAFVTHVLTETKTSEN